VHSWIFALIQYTGNICTLYNEPTWHSLRWGIDLGWHGCKVCRLHHELPLDWFSQLGLQKQQYEDILKLVVMCIGVERETVCGFIFTCWLRAKKICTSLMICYNEWYHTYLYASITLYKFCKTRNSYTYKEFSILRWWK
jgi:hypothetical protein